MIKKISIITLLLIVTFIISLNIWHADVFILKNNMKKYTALTIYQNSGFKREVLIFFQSVAKYLPSYPALSESEISDVFESQYNQIHSKVGDQKTVHTIVELKEAVKIAIPGDVIILADGEYKLEGNALNLGNPNYLLDSELPITITSRNFKKAKINVNATVGINITYKNWIISDLVFEGTCDSDSSCEHALHIFGDADNIKIMGNDFINFNAAIKANGNAGAVDGVRYFPDSVLIQSNRFYNEWARETKAPVTPIDVVGGEFWTISNNFIADFSRNYKRKTSYTYGAFLKGDSKYGVFKSNFIACRWKVPYYSALDLRIGLSFGGGGTGNEFCASGTCEQEHLSGEMSSNIIANCSQTASIYVNKSNDIKIEKNILIGSSGIELSASSEINVSENLLNGKLRKRNRSSSVIEQSNHYFQGQVSYSEY